MKTPLFSHPGKPLAQHLETVAIAAEQAVATIPWTDAALGTTLQEVARLIGLYHDVGKGTSYFRRILHGMLQKITGSSNRLPGFVSS